MNPNLQKDLLEGQAVENELKALLETKGLTVTTTQDDGHNPKYDLLVKTKKNNTYTMEVKYDRMMDATGNVAIELSKVLNGVPEPSGLSITEADYYVYKLNKHFYSIPTQDLKDLVDKLKNNGALIMCMGGDNKSVSIGLISTYIFKKYSKKIT